VKRRNTMSEKEINERGNEIIRGSDFGGDRYRYDFKICTTEKGWRQFDTDQDAHYFGVWVNMEKRQTFTYCEGDTVLVICPTAESFAAELDSMHEFYGPPPPMATAISMDGKVTEFYDERPSSKEVLA